MRGGNLVGNVEDKMTLQSLVLPVELCSKKFQPMVHELQNLKQKLEYILQIPF